MPRDPFKPLLAKEQKFVFHFLREGGAEERINIVARKCRVPFDEAKAIYKRKHVQAAIEQRRRLIEWEENKLIAKDKAVLAREEDERDRVTLHKIEQALDKVINLNAETHGAIVLKGIELGLVYTGTIRNGNQVKLKAGELDPEQKPLDGGGPDPAGPSFYRSIFAQERENGAVPTAAAPIEPPAPLIPPEAEKPKKAETKPAAQPAKKTAAKSSFQEKEIEIT